MDMPERVHKSQPQRFSSVTFISLHTLSLRKAFYFSSELSGWGIEVNKKLERTLDCLGLYCPEPVFKTRLELDDMRLGETLEVLADDPAAESDIRSLVKNLGQELISVDKKGERVRILIKKVK